MRRINMNRRLLKGTVFAAVLSLTASLFTAPVLAESNASTPASKAEEVKTETLTIPANLKDEQVLKHNLGAEPKTLDPALNTAVEAGTVLQNLFVGLMKTDANMVPVPGAAESYTVSDDQLVYTFKLKDAKWSDGQPVKAEDFRYAWIRALDPKTLPNPAEYAYQLYYIKNGEKFNKGEVTAEEVGIKAIDDKTLEVTLEAPCAYFLSLTAFPTYFPVRKDMVEKNPEKWATQKDTYVSNGPFKFESWTNKDKIIIVKNENYYDAKNVALNKIEMSLVDDAQTALAAFQAGELDTMEGPPNQEIPGLLADGTAKVLPYLGTYFYVINMRPELKNTNPAVYEALSKVQVRKALYLAIDKKALIDNVTLGNQTPAWGFVPKGIPDYDGSDFADKKKHYAEDSGNIEEAKKLLAEAGYPNGEGFPLLTIKYNNGTGHQNIAVAVQAMWKQNLGIDVQLANEEWAVFQTSRINGDYEIARHGWIADYADPMTMLDMWVSGTGEGVWGNNDAHYNNPEYDKLIKAAKVELDPAKRSEMLHKAQDIIMEDLPILPIYFYTNIVCYRPYAKQVVKSPLGFIYFENAYIEK